MPDQHGKGVSDVINFEGVEYLTASEASELLGVKIATLYAYASRGRVRSYRRGIRRERFYRRDEIEALLHIRPAAEPPGPDADPRAAPP